jgi:hypothetical protein
MKENLLDLYSLSIKLQAISDELEKSEDSKRIAMLASEILELMEQRVEYYYQFFHGGIATGFNFFSAELMNKCQKIIAIVKFNQLDVIPEIKGAITDRIKDIVRDIDSDSHWRQPNVAILSLYKPPEWMQASSFFVSYSHKDKIAEEILPVIQFKIGNTVDIWIDKYDLKRHQQLPKEISGAIQKSSASMLILSKNFFESKWCNEEWQSIFMKRLLETQYRLYLIRIDDEKYPPLLNAFYYTDCRRFPKPEALVELGKLLREIQDFETLKRFRTRPEAP